ncbi:MAG: ABC transporter permease [Candidatus Glassbacteria bacterium]|nr:ABC transporter permease [Candidatus Glassbacteria bacterium]
MIRLALSNLTQRKMRSAISVLALAVGICLFITLWGLVNGVLNEFTQRIRGIGADITVTRTGTNPLLFGTGVLPYKLGDRIREIHGVRTVSPVLIWKANIGSAPYNVFGIEPQEFTDLGGQLTFLSGRNIEGPDEMFVDSRIADLQKLSVDDTLSLLGHHFRITGIVQPGVGTRIFVPYQTLSRITSQPDRVSLFFVSARSPELVEQVASQISGIDPGIETQFMSNIAASMSKYLKALNQFIRAINYTALVISALVILLSMYTTVVERTREIGILKSLGASRVYILATILIEAVLLSLMGSVAGIILAFISRSAIQWQFQLITVEISAGILASSVLLGFGVGLVGAFYPALWASRQDPINALVYD